LSRIQIKNAVKSRIFLLPFDVNTEKFTSSLIQLLPSSMLFKLKIIQKSNENHKSIEKPMDGRISAEEGDHLIVNLL
jgi:hypothetical protein